MPTSEPTDGKDKVAGESSDAGSRLRRAREAQGLTLEDLGNELRVGAAALAALEENRFDALGAPVFAKGYLKQYGARLGLDVRELATLYERAASQAQVDLAPTKSIRLRDERRVTLRVVATLALVLIVGGLSYWWMRHAAPDPVQAAAGIAAEPDASPPAMPRATAAQTPAAGGGELAAVPAPEAAADPAVEPPAAATAAPPGVATSPPAAVVETRIASAAPLTAVPDGPSIELFFAEDSWAEVTDEGGSRLFRDLGRAGTRALFPADRNLSIYLGNASGVELRIDGEVVPVPGAATRDVVRFDLDDVID